MRRRRRKKRRRRRRRKKRRRGRKKRKQQQQQREDKRQKKTLAGISDGQSPAVVSTRKMSVVCSRVRTPPCVLKIYLMLRQIWFEKKKNSLSIGYPLWP